MFPRGVMSLCARRHEPGPRTVHANAPELNADFSLNVVSNTKYSWWNFVPKNLFEQFHRATNMYFLLIACLQLNKDITPVNPLTTWAPLAVIFMITAVKEGLDDWGRRAQDKVANARLYTAVRGGARVQVRCRATRAAPRRCHATGRRSRPATSALATLCF